MGMGLIFSLGSSFVPASNAQEATDLETITPAPFLQPTAPQELSEILNIFGSSPQVGAVHLDGRELFLVTVPTSDVSGEALEQRIESIEAQLYDIASQGFDPDTIEVGVSAAPSNGNELVITINDQYLMTVTELDAQIQGLERRAWANRLTNLLFEAMRRYEQERQPSFLVRQAWKVAGLVLTASLLTGLLEVQRRRLKSRQDEILTQLSTPPGELEEPEQQITTEARTAQQQAELRLYLLQQLIFLLQLSFWGGTLILSLGFFPYSRSIQLWILKSLRGPLLRLGLTTLVTVVGVKLSSYFIDQVFAGLQRRHLLLLHSKEATADRLDKRIRTFSGVAKGTGATATILVGGLVGLVLVGINIGPLLTGLGFIGLGLSLAGQDLIKDIINGLLILFEDQYAEGDVVVVDGKGGLVENINLRITQLRNTEGSLITIPNSAIRVVENLSNGWSRVDLSIEVAYDTDLDQAMRVIEAVAVRMSRDYPWKEKIIDYPQILGVDGFGNHSIALRIWIKVKPLAQWDVAREFRRRLKLAFDQNGITIPFPQQDVWLRSAVGVNGPGSQLDQEQLLKLQHLQNISSSQE
ncbi:MAG: mechanosensitive ion channel family protein [Synechococcaceae cyanobacterium SM2_3_1]|nr:mechanosensitive ion channel family protein [Synechococcaceae cyanobacterium SM2_3_1]